VAHSLSANKRVRQNLKARARNRFRKEAIKDSVKGFLGAITAGDLGKAETELRTVAQRLGRISTKGTIHKNAANRKRSRLTKRLNAARAAAAAAPAATTTKTKKGAGTKKA
jgi:small subunit ribosomal protein S20